MTRASRGWLAGAFQNILLACVALLLALLGAEGLVRLAGGVSGGVASVSAADFDRIPGPFEPDQSVVERRVPALPFPVHINALGYRGPQFPLQKPAAEFRILMAGDSFTFGDFVTDEETLPAQLADALGQCRPGVRVINGGLGGSTLEAQRHIIERGLVLQPDLVVLTFYENDIADLANSQWDELAANRAARSRLPLSIAYPVMRRLATWSLLLRVRAQARARARVDNTEAAPAADKSARLAALRRQYAELFREVTGLLAARGVYFVFATYPSHLTLTTGRSDELMWVEEMARRHGVIPTPLLPALAAVGQSADALYLLPLDGHPRPIGYRTAAGLLRQAVISSAQGRLECPPPLRPSQ